jgi:hypothetical protein
MNNVEIQKLVQQYIDGELDKGYEPLLFSTLAADEEGRTYFKMMNLLHNAVEDKMEEFPEELEERIFKSVEKKETHKLYTIKRNFYLIGASLSIAVLMLIISSFLFFELKEYKSRIDIVSEQVMLQNQTIELILNNSLPPAEVEMKRVNEIIIKANL